MTVTSKRPADFVKFLVNPGLATDAGSVPLNQYMCKNIGNGGNDNADSVIRAIRYMKDKVSGRTLQDTIPGNRIDIMWKGQGRPDDVVTTMNFIVRNKEQLKKCNMTAVHRIDGADGTKNTVVVNDRSGSIYDLYFAGRGDAAALSKMVEDKVFGLDCIGFVANYLIWIGAIPEYPSYEVDQWHQKYFTEKAAGGDDVGSLDAVIWPGIHIALIDRVRSWDAQTNTLICDVSQSSSGGPLSYSNVTFLASGDGFMISGGNSTRTPPTVPVTGRVVAWGCPDLHLSFPSTPSEYPAAISTFPRAS